MQRAVIFFVLSVIVFCNSAAKKTEALTPDEVMARLTDEQLTYQEMMECMDFCAAPALLEDFYRIYALPSKRLFPFKNASEVPLNLDFCLDTNQKQERYLSSVMVMRKIADHVSVWTHIGYSHLEDQGELGRPIYFDNARVEVLLYPNKNLKELTVRTRDRLQRVKFDKDMNITSDQSHKYDSVVKKAALEGRKKIADAIEVLAKQRTEVPLDKKMDAAVQIPARLEDRTTVLKDLKRLETYLQGVKKGSLLVLAENKIFDSGSTYVGIHEYLGMIRFVSVSQGDRGFFLEFNEQGRIHRFIEGDIEFDMNATGKTIGQTAKMPPKGSGTEITFHPTGYPATYKTIVKGNLFGRQMEWNDKGEMISDIDLDIPRPLTDVTKK